METARPPGFDRIGTAPVRGPAPGTSRTSGPVRESVLPYLRILNMIGGTDQACVYLAEWKPPGRGLVAVKRWRPARASACRPEAETLRLLGLDHPHIATVFDIGLDADGRFYTVTEYVPGCPLIRFCDRHRLGLPSRLELLRDMTAALEYGHAHDVHHLHVKSSNVVVARFTGVKLLDFDAATPGDASPAGEKAVAADVLAAGLLVCEALSACVPDARSAIQHHAEAMARTAGSPGAGYRALHELSSELAALLAQIGQATGSGGY